MTSRYRLAILIALTMTTIAAPSISQAAAKTFSINDAQALEGSGGDCFGAGVIFTVTRSSSQGTASVTVRPTATGTATLGTDYGPRSIDVTFTAGKTSKQINIRICHDTQIEPDETFGLILENPSNGYRLAKATGTGTILNDDTTCTPGAPGCGWEAGDMVTFHQAAWGDTSGSAASLLTANFTTVYFSTGGVLDVGIPGSAGFSMSFTNPPSITQYLPASGTPGALTQDHVNPTTSSSGIFGGEVVALKLNVDFSDADLTGGTAPFAFGDVLICGAAPLADMTVRDFLAVANSALGGGSNGYLISDLDALAAQVNASFFNGPSTWAQEHLFSGSCP
jgi:Calx-beta domain-containing protein